MDPISYSRHRFPPVIIQHAVWLYFRFSLSYRDVEDLLAERGIDVSYETIRRLAEKFGRFYARRLGETLTLDAGYRFVDLGQFQTGRQFSNVNVSAQMQQRIKDHISAHGMVVGLRYRY